MKLRLMKIIIAFSLAFYMTLVIFNNMTDPDTNYKFIRAVFTMTDLSSGEDNRWRSINFPILNWVGFIIILTIELTSAVLLWKGSVAMLKARKSSSDTFSKARATVSTGIFAGLFLWFTVFLTVGGEWFLMWQSEKFNAQHTAFSLTIVFTLFLILMHQRDTDSSSSGSGR